MNARAPIVEPNRIAQMIEHMTVAQIAARLGVTEDVIEDNLEQAGVGGRGKWLLRCHKTGREWWCHTERACYRRAQILGLVDYDLGQMSAAPLPQDLPGDVNARIAELLGRGWTYRRIGDAVGMSGAAVCKRIKKMAVQK